MTSLVDYQKQGSLGVITLNNPPVNALSVNKGVVQGILDALKEGDHSTNTMLQWFVNEQVEEEASADDVVQKLKLIGDNTSALFLLDNELASRSFAPESGVE